jgi:hypothetical protein
MAVSCGRTAYQCRRIGMVVKPQIPPLGCGWDDDSFAKRRFRGFSQRKPQLAVSTRIVIPTGAYPDFLLRGTIDGRVCGFL